MLASGSFDLGRRGDSHYGTAEGYRTKRTMVRGGTTPAASYLLSKGVELPHKTDWTERSAQSSEAIPNTPSRKRGTLSACVTQTSP